MNCLLSRIKLFSLPLNNEVLLIWFRIGITISIFGIKVLSGSVVRIPTYNPEIFRLFKRFLKSLSFLFQINNQSVNIVFNLKPKYFKSLMFQNLLYFVVNLSIAEFLKQHAPFNIKSPKISRQIYTVI